VGFTPHRGLLGVALSGLSNGPSVPKTAAPPSCIHYFFYLSGGSVAGCPCEMLFVIVLACDMIV
jgi:hypothetical protein